MGPGDDGDHWRSLSDSERIDYLIVVASVVAADHDVDAAELAPIEELCRALELPETARDAVLGVARRPQPAMVDASLSRLKRNVALRVELLTDVIAIVFADGKVAPGESEVVARLGRALEIPPAQIGLIGRYVESVILGRTGDEPSLSRDLGDGVAGAQRTTHGPGVIRRIYGLFRRDRDDG
jgi:uncharacterized tellurite resistance protein B-like protein